MNKVINAFCACGDYNSLSKNGTIILLPCEHIIHYDCINLIKNSRCPVCKNKVEKLFTYKEVQTIWRKTKNKKYYQRYVDMASIKYMWDMGEVDFFRFLFKFPTLSLYCSQLIGSNDYESVKSLSDNVLNLANIQIKVIGINKVKNIPRVIISNHTMELDAIIINHVFKCGFVASSRIKDTFYGEKISKIAPLILIDRGKSKNTVQKIKEFLETNNKPICIFPEGFLSHPKTIARFRSGSFNTGFPVQPIVIKYDPTICDNNPAFLLAKLFSQEKIVVTIHVLDIEYPPFSKQKIEEIRNKMGKVGNMALSRVSSRDIIDH